MPSRNGPGRSAGPGYRTVRGVARQSPDGPHRERRFRVARTGGPLPPIPGPQGDPIASPSDAAQPPGYGPARFAGCRGPSRSRPRAPTRCGGTRQPVARSQPGGRRVPKSSRTCHPVSRVRRRSPADSGIPPPARPRRRTALPLRRRGGSVPPRTARVAASRHGAARVGDNSAAVAVFFGANRGVHAPAGRWTATTWGTSAPRPRRPRPACSARRRCRWRSTPPAGGSRLLKPVWFKLQLQNNVWTPYTSLDGSTWAMAGTPQLSSSSAPGSGSSPPRVTASSRSRPCLTTSAALPPRPR